MKNKEHYFRLYSSCIAVKGFTRCLIFDIQRGGYYEINTFLYDILTSSEYFSDAEIESKVSGEEMVKLDACFEFLEIRELGRWIHKDQIGLFGQLSREFDYPASITNAIVDIALDASFLKKEVFQDLSGLGCQHIQLRCFHVMKMEDIRFLFESSIVPASFSSVDLFCKQNDHIHDSEWINLMASYPSITGIVLHSAAVDAKIYESDNGKKKIFSLVQRIDSIKHCGNIGDGYFNMSMPHFLESFHYNTCLNRKISIDSSGEIRNCPSMPRSFGNIKDTSLRSAMDKQGFKEVWNIHKGQIAACKDCEYRHICTDCRAYLRDPEDVLSKPLKCGYDPYTGKWEQWSDNSLSKKGIEYYNLVDIF